MTVTVVAGNPKVRSRTLDAAMKLAACLSAHEADAFVDVIDLGPGLLGWGDPAVAAGVELVRTSQLVVFASPTFKGAYTGVLKLFLDQFATGDGLQNVVAVPLMLGAAPSHAMAPDLVLKPVLVELGATAPAPGLYLQDSTYLTDSRISDYCDRWGAILRSAAGIPNPPRSDQS